MPDRTKEKPQREVSEPDKKLAAEWLKRIKAAAGRFEKEHARFERNRKLLRGIDPDTGDKMLANLHFANLAMMRPQIYAKDPEFAVQPSKGVPPQKLKAMQGFSATAESLLHEMLVKRAKLKKRAKRLLTAAYTTSVGWWKMCWQEDRRADPIITNRIKDTQDNLARLQRLRDEMDDPSAAQDTERQIAEITQTLAGLQEQAEVTVARGLALDFVLSEDLIILDESVLELGDYERSGAIAHRVWMTKEQYREKFGYDAEKGKSYSAQSDGKMAAAGASSGNDRSRELLCTYEVWDQASNRIFHVCEGEEGFCREPFTPDWTGERWYPFFGVVFNEVEGQFYPLSDIEMTEQLVREYNDTRTDFRRDRKYALPLNIVRKGGALSPDDVKRISNREGGDTIVVEGVGGQPISNDVWSGQLATIKPENYDTKPARADMEMIVGGGDAARGSVLQAKTATEAEILSQGLRGRTAERQDTMEDMLSEVGAYALQAMLRKMTAQEVAEIAGPDAVWPEMTRPEDVFKQVTVDVRGGSTGKPDRLQEQDRWTKLLPVIEKAMAQVAELRASGNEQQAQAIVALIRETLRRFDERIDIEQFLPLPEEGQDGSQPADPMQSPQVQQLMQQGQQMMQELQTQVQQLEQKLADKEADRMADLEKARINAERDVALVRVKAHIEAEAQIQAARVSAEFAARAQVEVAAINAAARPPEASEPGDGMGMQPPEQPEAPELGEIPLPPEVIAMLPPDMRPLPEQD